MPITLQNLITIGINMMDTIMLGALGETALSASALANQFINLFQICCMGIGMGAAVLTSRYWGARDRTSLKMAITVALRVCLLFASLFTLVSALAPRAILGFYTPQTEVIEAGATYLLWSLPTFFLGGLSLITTNIMRSVNLEMCIRDRYKLVDFWKFTLPMYALQMLAMCAASVLLFPM